MLDHLHYILLASRGSDLSGICELNDRVPVAMIIWAQKFLNSSTFIECMLLERLKKTRSGFSRQLLSSLRDRRFGI